MKARLWRMHTGWLAGVISVYQWSCMMNEYLYNKNDQVTLYKGNSLDVLKTLPDESINCVVTSPPYYNLRDYGHKDQLGLETTLHEYIINLVDIFKEVKRVLAKDGTVWLNIGDKYSKVDDMANNVKQKDLMGIPFKVAFALQDDGWYLRQDIIWDKISVLPESVKDRCTKSHEYIFLFSKSPEYYYDALAIKEPSTSQDNYIRDRDNPNNKTNTTPMRNYIAGLKHNDYEYRNKRDVWRMGVALFKDVHYAVFPKELPMTCIKAGTREGDVVLDLFAGTGTTLQVAQELGRKSIGIDIKAEYLDMCLERTKQMGLF